MNSDIPVPQSSQKGIFTDPIFFYFLDKAFHHLSICLAEGLKQLGIPFYSNINFWQISQEREEYLFSHDPNINPDDCSVVVLNKDLIFSQQPKPENLFHPERKYTLVYLDDMDGPTIWNPEFRMFDIIFRTHYNSKFQEPENCIPWAFGLSNRILRETTDIRNFQERRKHLLVNFRVEQDRLKLSNFWLKVSSGFVIVSNGVIMVDNPLRPLVRAQLFPLLKELLPVEDSVDSFANPPEDSYHYLQWAQTGSRHHPNYYKRLKESVACAAFGGYITHSADPTGSRAEWWDNWRFWESLAAGCVTFHVDFDKYGILLPVMPENWRHYIGIDLDNIQSAVDRIASDPGVLEKISKEGKTWALENYGPVPTALRFIEEIYGVSLNFEDSNSGIDSLDLNLNHINLIIFPDWSVPENYICFELSEVILRIYQGQHRFATATHPDQNNITLLIDTSGISSDDANLVISSVTMNLMMQEDLDVSDKLEISLLVNLTKIQWQELLPRLHARLVLENENKQAIAEANAENLLSIKLDSLGN